MKKCSGFSRRRTIRSWRRRKRWTGSFRRKTGGPCRSSWMRRFKIRSFWMKKIEFINIFEWNYFINDKAALLCFLIFIFYLRLKILFLTNENLNYLSEFIYTFFEENCKISLKKNFVKVIRTVTYFVLNNYHAILLFYLHLF